MSAFEIVLIVICLVLLTDNVVGYIRCKALIRLAALDRLGAERLHENCGMLQDAVRAAREVFAHYEKIHTAKGTPDGRHKAANNARMVMVMTKALELTDFKVGDQADA